MLWRAKDEGPARSAAGSVASPTANSDTSDPIRAEDSSEKLPPSAVDFGLSDSLQPPFLFPMTATTPCALFEPLDLERLPRAEHFRTFTEAVPCTFAMTVPLDVTGAVARHRAEGVPLYALLMHAILGAMNAPDLPEFRFDWSTTDGRNEVPGVWSRVGANFTHMNPKTRTFMSLWLPWIEDEAEFVTLYRETIERFGRSTRMVPQGSIPPNHVPISMIPWAAYTGFQVNLPNFRYLRPVVTMGKFGPSAADPARLTLPFTLQLHHATADGWHASEALRRIELATH